MTYMQNNKKTNGQIEMLNDKDLAMIANNLQLPMAIEEILNNEASLNEGANYALHELISEMQPDTALLAMALGALKISERFANELPSFRALSFTARQIVEEYGQIWLENAETRPDVIIDESNVQDLLCHIPEDLESIAELSANGRDLLIKRAPEAAALLNILHVQAGSHAIIAEEYLRILDLEDVRTEPEATFTNNVVQFPAPSPSMNAA